MGCRYGPVVGVDGSADSVGAPCWAVDEACRHSRELRVVHVLRPAAPPDELSRGIADDAAFEGSRWLPGVYGWEPARRTLRLGFEEAASRRSWLIVSQVWQHPDMWQPSHHRHGLDLSTEDAVIRTALREAARPWQVRHPLVEMELRSEPGDPADALSVASQWALLMVLGTRRTGDPVRPADPSVLHRVLRQMACPAFIAHDPGRLPASGRSLPRTPPAQSPADPLQEVRHGEPV